MSTLQDLAPTEKFRVIDLVKQAGVNVDDWKNYKNGEKNPGANPKYCYEWAYVEPGKVVVLNLWHQDMKDQLGDIEYHLNERIYQATLGTQTPKYHRAGRVEAAVRMAYTQGLPIKVIVLLKKDRKDQDESATLSSKRSLDTEVWHVKSFDEATGEIWLRRGPAVRQVVDQFSVAPLGNEDPERHESTSLQFKRSQEVRQFVLRRSNGKCEYCGELGFKLRDGRTYVETHHIVPLSDGGPDTVANVVALCANHHREAHYGEGSVKIASHLKVLTKT